MTRQEALAEAQRRWGPNAFADREGDGWYLVGSGEQDDRYGTSSDSWEAAFADADKRDEFRKMQDMGEAMRRVK